MRRTLIALALLAACAKPQPAVRLVHDDLGRAVRVPGHVQRVVTLAPNLTEIVYAIGAGDRLAGTDDFSDEPPAAKKLPKLGGMNPDLERIVSMHPDLVLVLNAGSHPKVAASLDRLGIAVYVVRTDRLSDVSRAMRAIGSLLAAPAAEVAAAHVDAGLAAERRKRTPEPRVAFAVWLNPPYVAGHDTFADDLIALAGAQNVLPAKYDGWPQISAETLVADPPDAVLYADRSVSSAQVDQFLAAAPTLHGRTAFIGVDENRFTRPGPRVVEAAAELNEILDRWERAR